MTTATLALNLNTTQAEAMLKAIKVSFEGLGKSADNASQKANNFAVTLQKGVQNIKLAKLQGDMIGLSNDIRTASATAKQLSANFMDLFFSGKQVGVMYADMAGQQYKVLLNYEAEIIAQEKLISASTKQAAIIAETKNLQSGATATLAKHTMVLETNLAVAKAKHMVSQQTLKDLALQTIATHNLTAAQKNAVLKDLGFVDKTKEVASVKALTEAERVDLIVKNKIIAAQTELDTLKAESIVLTDKEFRSIQRKTAVARADLAITQARTAAYKLEAMGISNVRIANAGLTESMTVQALVNAGLASHWTAKPSTPKNIKATTAATKNLTAAFRGLAIASNATSLAFGNIIPLFAAFGTAMLAFKTVFAGAKFEYIAKYIEAIDTPASGAKLGLEGIYEGILKIKGVADTPIELAGGVKELVKAGYPAATAINEIGLVSQFASVAQIELADAVEIAITQFKAWGPGSRKWGEEVNSMGEVMQAIAYVANETKASVADMGISLTYTTELANLTSASFYDITASIGALADIGIEGSKSGRALRTAIERLQDPTSKATKLLKKFGVEFSAVDWKGNLKGPLQMFEDLRDAMAHLGQKDQTSIMVEAFGRNAAKAGVNMTMLVETTKRLSIEARKAAEEGKYIQDAYEKIMDTVVGQWDIFKAALQKSFIDVFSGQNTEDMKNSIKELTGYIGSDSFKGGIKFIADGVIQITAFAVALTQLMGAIGKAKIDMGDLGLLTVALFGTGGPMTWFALVALAVKKVLELADGIIRLKEVANKEGTFPTYLENIFKWVDRLKYALPAPFALAIDMAKKLYQWIYILKNEKPAPLYNEESVSHTKRVFSDLAKSHKSSASDMAKSHASATNDIIVSHGNATNSIESMHEKTKKVAVASAEKMGKSLSDNLDSVIKGFDGYDKVIKQFAKDSAYLWKEVERASELSTEEQLNNFKILRTAWGAVDDDRTFKNPAYGMKKSGLTIDGKEVTSAYLKYRTVAQKFYYDLGDMATRQRQRESKALDDYVNKFKEQASEMVSLTGPVGEALKTLSVNPDMLKNLDEEGIKSLGEKFVKAAEVAKPAFDEFFKEVEKGIDNLIKKEQKLLGEIKKYSDDMGSVHKTAGDARFSLIQKYATEAQKYYNIVDRINQLNSKAIGLGNAAKGLTGDARVEMYEKAKQAASEALSLSSQLNEVEGTTITKLKAIGDEKTAINQYEKIAYNLAKDMKASAQDELQTIAEKRKKLESVGEAIQEISTVLGKVHTLKLDTTEAMKQIQALSEALAKAMEVPAITTNTTSTNTNPNNTINTINTMPTFNRNTNNQPSGETVTVNINLPGSDQSIPAKMSKANSTEFIAQLQKMERLSS